MNAEPTAVAETHSAVVFFVGDRAFKMKKPVDLGFLDFTTREQREAICHREVELNRRLAPDVYLGVANVLGPNGTVCDHLVVMRRMPATRRLSTLVRAGMDVDRHLRAIAKLVAGFHARADRSPDTDAAATRDAVRANWEANIAEMGRFVGPLLPEESALRVAALARRYLAGRQALFDQRIHTGRARDGHGDLLVDDVFCLDDGPRILDCLEFDDRLRYGDVLLDAAFLAMDLERLGHPELGTRFLEWWGEYGGETHPSSLADHYVAYRAQVRAKVGCLRAEQGDASAADEARRLLDVCLDHLERARIRLVLVGGLPGTGKTTLAMGLAEARGLVLFRSDEVRKELAGIGLGERNTAPYGHGIYTSQHTAHTYEALLDRAKTALGLGESVVLDASWTDRAWRERAAAVAEATSSELVELRCATPHDEAARRLAARAAEGQDASDATPAIAAAMALRSDSWPSAATIDTTGLPSVSLAAALSALHPEQSRSHGR